MKTERFIPFVMSLALFMEYIDSTVIMTSLPEIAKSLNANTEDMKLAVNAYFIGMGCVLPVCAWAVHKLEAIIVFRLAIILFLLSSILCSESNSLIAFVSGRLSQGACGALLVPVARIIMLQSVRKEEYMTSINRLSMLALLAPMTGPAIGGFITYNYSWRWIFYINLPIGIALFLMSFLFFEKVKQAALLFDWKGYFLVLLSFITLAAGITFIDKSEVFSISLALLFVGFILSCHYYKYNCRRISKGKGVLLNFNYLKIKTFRSGIIGGGCFRVGMAGFWMLSPVILQHDLRLSPVEAGYIACSSAAGGAIMKLFSTNIIRSIGFRKVLFISTLLTFIVLSFSALALLLRVKFETLLFLYFLYGIFTSVYFSASNSISYSNLNKEELTDATGLLTCLQLLTTITGVSASIILLKINCYLTGSLDIAHSFTIAMMGGILLLSLFCTLSLSRKDGDAIMK